MKDREMWQRKKIMAGFIAAAMLMLNACASDPGEKDYRRGAEAFAAEDYEKAEKYLKDALAKNPDKAEFYLYYGFTLTELGRYEEAAENFERVILEKSFDFVQDNNKRAYRGAGIARYYAGEYMQALEDFYAALQIERLKELDDDIREYMLRTQAALLDRYRSDGELEKALELCETLLSQYGESKDIYRLRADIFMEQKRYEEAAAEFVKARERGDERVSTLLGELLAWQAAGDEEKLKSISARLAEVTPQSEEEMLAAGIAAYSLKEYTAAREQLESLYVNGNPEAAYYLAQVDIAEGDYSSAVEYLATVEQAKGGNAELYYQMALCYLNEEQTGMAAKYLTKLEETGDLSFLRGQEKLNIALLEKQSRWQEAYDRMKEYMELYIDENDAEYEEASRELEFLTRIVQ